MKYRRKTSDIKINPSQFTKQMIEWCEENNIDIDKHDFFLIGSGKNKGKINYIPKEYIAII